jgi:hypothetical protein
MRTRCEWLADVICTGEANLDEILHERVVSSRNRSNFRGVKRKMSNYNLRPRKRQRIRHIDV